MIICFCGEHYNPLGLIRSVGESSRFLIDAIVIKNKTKIASKSRYINKAHIVSNIEEGYDLLINEYGIKEKDIILTCDDSITSYLDNRYEEIKNRFYFFNAGEQGRINKFMLKENIQALAKECGFNIPYSIIVENSIDEIKSIKGDITYPIITKAISSIVGGWKNDVFVCNDEEELFAALPKIQSKRVCLQQYLKKDNELCLDGYSYDKGKKVLITIASKYDYILPDTYSPLMTIKNFYKVDKYEEIKNNIEKMFSIIGFEGIFSIEFLIKGTDLYFLEINFRNSTWSYASTVANMNLPVLWIDSMLGNPVHNPIKEIPQNFKAMVEPADFKNRVIKHLPSKMKLTDWLKERKKCACLFYKNRYDKKPYFSYLLTSILSKLF